MTYLDLEQLCVGQESSIQSAIECMDRVRLGIVMVVGEDRKLIGTITDGDIRRALLAHTDLGSPVSLLLARKGGTLYSRPITAFVHADRATHLRLLKQHNILHLPLVDEEGRLAGLVSLDDFVPERTPSVQAVVMAGGAGRRMRPLTDETPKPMLPVGSRPLMEIIIQQLKDVGIKRLHVTTHHNSQKITEHFKDGRDFGVELTYVNEERPLGTAGALGLMEASKDTLLVINGDILTQVDFRAMLTFHREHRADLSVAVRQYDIHVPFGVVECQGAVVHRLTEKPSLSFFINAGIYLLEPCVHDFIPNGERFDMTDLIQRLLTEGRNVVSFPIREYWLDIGLPDDYEQAQNDMKQGKLLK